MIIVTGHAIAREGNEDAMQALDAVPFAQQLKQFQVERARGSALALERQKPECARSRLAEIAAELSGSPQNTTLTQRSSRIFGFRGKP